MARINLVTEQNASGEGRAIYDDIKKTMEWTLVPETFQMMAHNLDHLRAYWNHYKKVMMQGRVDLRTKKIIAFVVSAVNNCGP